MTVTPTDKHSKWAVAALVAAAVLPFISTLLFGFVYDDIGTVVRNANIRGWSSLLTLWTKPYWVMNGADSSGLYRPLPMVVSAVLWNAGLRYAIWFHLVAVAGHAVATVLVWRLLRRGVSPAGALLGGLWFAVHPLHIEAVANVTNSSEVLVTIAVLAFVLAVLRAREPVSWSSAAAAGAWYAAALLTKESGVTAPGLALLAIWGWRAQGVSVTLRDLWNRWRRVIVACVVVLAAFIVVRGVVLGGVVTGKDIAAPGLEGLSAWSRIWAMLALGPTMVRLLVWPRVVNPHYGPDLVAGHSGPTAPTILFVAGIVVIAVLAWRMAARGDRRIAVGLAWTALAFLPASNVLIATGQILAERTLYLPSVGVTLLVGYVVDLVAHRLPRAPLAIAAAAAAAGLVVAARTTHVRSGVWRNQRTVYTQMIAADPNNHRGYWLLGWYDRDAKPAEALAMYERAYTLYPRDSEFLIDYVRLLLKQGRTARAAAIGAELMDWPNRRQQPEVVALYLESVRRAYGPDSVLAAEQRLRARER